MNPQQICTKPLLWGFLVISLVGCTSTDQNPVSNSQPPSRVVAVSPVPRLDPPPTVQDFVAALDLVYNSGARAIFLSWIWSALDSAGTIALDDIPNALTYLTRIRGFDVVLGVQVINTNRKETPSDLQNTPFDSPQVQSRFRLLIDALRPHVNERVKYISIGNEVDIYLSAHPNEWGTYKSFYEGALAYVHSTMPHVKVGVTSTFAGAVGPAASNVGSLNQSSDVIILTYYPLDDQFFAYNPAAPLTDFPKMVPLGIGKPIILQEVGYPTSALLASSEQEQSEFVRNVFTAWQNVGDRIPLLNFFALHDFSQDLCDSLLVYYGAPPTAVNFKEFLCTLGLRRVDGTPKLSWQAFVNGAVTIR